MSPLTSEATLRLQKRTNVEQHSTTIPIEAQKKIELSEKGDVKVTHTIVNVSDRELHCKFAIEWCANFLAPKAHDRYFEADGARLSKPDLVSSGVVTDALQLRIVDEYLQLSLSWQADGAEFWRMPIETISMSEGGFERVYQGSIILLVWELKLDAGAAWQKEVTVKFESP